MLKQFFRIALILLVVLMSGQYVRFVNLVAAAPAFTAASNIVISEIQVAGDGGANDEFVELYNPTAAPIDISGWSLQYLGGGASTFNKRNFTTAANTVIPANGFYLVVGSAYNGLTSSDFTLSAYSFSGTGATIFLVNNQSTLTTGSEASIVDKVAYGSGTLYPEGAAAPVPASEQSIARNSVIGGGGAPCDETNDNSVDFTVQSPPGPQNTSSGIVYCLVPSDTPTATATGTETSTPTVTPTPTNTPVYPTRSLLINEVAWAGTAADPNDEWIELYNPGSAAINLSGWRLVSSGTNPALDISLSGAIAPGGYFLLERTDDNNVSSIPADQIYTGALSNTGDFLLLYAPDGSTVVDSANWYPDNIVRPWPAGSASPNFSSMERHAIVADSATAWFTYANNLITAYDAQSNPIKGTPRQTNWAYGVTATPYPTSTPTRTATATIFRTPYPSRTPTPVVDAIVINEFLPRAASDWNKDGEINLHDEYIELINIGVAPTNLRGWRLNHIFGKNVTYILPEIIIQPNEKVIFFGLETNIILSDGGGTVRLLKPNGVPYDAVTYTLVTAADRSWCRVPDGRGLWQGDCEPTLRRANAAASGVAVTTPQPISYLLQRPSYPLPEACPLSGAPGEIIRAECDSPGLGLSNPKYVYRYKKR